MLGKQDKSSGWVIDEPRGKRSTIVILGFMTSPACHNGNEACNDIAKL